MQNLLIIFRSFLKQKIFFILNLSGLSIGIACFLLIGLYILNEWWVFIIAIVISLLVALATTAIHSYKVATVNPGKDP